MKRIAHAAVLSAALALVSCSSELEAVRGMEIATPPLARIAAGNYRGSYAYGGFEYVVSVRIVSGRIEGVDILANRDSSHAKKAEGVLPRILAAQSPDVEAVSGATTTSKALMKAVENALAQAPKD